MSPTNSSSRFKYIVITERDDKHVPLVEKHLDQPFITIDPADIVRGGQLSYSLRDTHIDILLDGQKVEGVRGVWYRKPVLVPSGELPVVEHLQKYSHYALKNFTGLIHTRFPEATWISDYYAIRRASDKILQLEIAARIGFKVPATMVTSAPHDARKFVQNLPGPYVVIKPIECDYFTDDGTVKVVVARKVPKDSVAYDGLHLAPSIFQQAIERTLDIRVAVVGKQVFAASLDTRDTPSNRGNSCDWSMNIMSDGFVIKPHALPPTIKALCIRHVQELGLKFGEIDLMLDTDGTYWFLENNPNGQWGFVELVTGQLIGKAIADLLMGVPARSK